MGPYKGISRVELEFDALSYTRKEEPSEPNKHEENQAENCQNETNLQGL